MGTLVALADAATRICRTVKVTCWIQPDVTNLYTILRKDVGCTKFGYGIRQCATSLNANMSHGIHIET